MFADVRMNMKSILLHSAPLVRVYALDKHSNCILLITTEPVNGTSAKMILNVVVTLFFVGCN